MATLLHLISEGLVARIDPELANEDRYIYALPRFRKWIESTLVGMASSWNIEVSPLEQFDELLDRFCSGDFLIVGHDFKCLHRHENGVWELKTADLRIFGWFYLRDTFIAAAAEAKWKIEESGLYHGMIEQTVRDRDRLELDPPKFLSGSDPNVVVSSFNFP
jgi:hypothetical protein